MGLVHLSAFPSPSALMTLAPSSLTRRRSGYQVCWKFQFSSLCATAETWFIFPQKGMVIAPLIWLSIPTAVWESPTVGCPILPGSRSKAQNLATARFHWIHNWTYSQIGKQSNITDRTYRIFWWDYVGFTSVETPFIWRKLGTRDHQGSIATYEESALQWRSLSSRECHHCERCWSAQDWIFRRALGLGPKNGVHFGTTKGWSFLDIFSIYITMLNCIWAWFNRPFEGWWIILSHSMMFSAACCPWLLLTRGSLKETVTKQATWSNGAMITMCLDF